MSEEPIAPGKAGIRETIAVFIATTRHSDAAWCFTLPLALFLLIFGIGRLLAPDFTAPTSDYSSFFSTAAQVIIAVLIALAFDLGKLPPWQLNTRRLVVGFSLGYIALGAAAAVIALLPGLSPTLDKWLFATTLAAGVAAVLSVLTISFQVVKGDAESVL